MTEEQKSEVEDSGEAAQAIKTPMDPVRKWTFIILGLCAVLMIWYLVADRITPYTTQARVHALVVPVAPEVSGTVIEVAVANNQPVRAGEELFRIERDRYQFALQTAQANLDSARQATGVSTANVDAARASVGSAEANLELAERDAVRMRGIIEEDPGAISVRRLEIAEASFAIAQTQLVAAQANLEKATQDLGRLGEENVRVMEAQAAVEQAEINLRRTTVLAPDDGVVTDVRVNRGNFAAAGAPQMTFIATHNIWVQADFTENNLGHIRAGNPVAMVFDALPGQVLEGRVRSAGFGVAVDSAPLGNLPSVENDRQWLRDAQRFPVLVDFQIPDARKRGAIRVGAQASVVVYTGDGWFFNGIAAFQVWLASILTYLY